MCYITQGGQGKEGGHFYGAKVLVVLVTNLANGNTALATIGSKILVLK